MITLFLNYDPCEGGFEVKIGDEHSIDHIYTSYGSLLYGLGDDVLRSGTYPLTASHTRLESTQIIQEGNTVTIWFCHDDNLPRRHWLCRPKNGAILYVVIRHIENRFTGRSCQVVGGINFDIPEKYHRRTKPIDQFIATYIERPGDNEHLMD